MVHMMTYALQYPGYVNLLWLYCGSLRIIAYKCQWPKIIRHPLALIFTNEIQGIIVLAYQIHQQRPLYMQLLCHMYYFAHAGHTAVTLYSPITILEHLSILRDSKHRYIHCTTVINLCRHIGTALLCRSRRNLYLESMLYTQFMWRCTCTAGSYHSNFFVKHIS